MNSDRYFAPSLPHHSTSRDYYSLHDCLVSLKLVEWHCSVWAVFQQDITSQLPIIECRLGMYLCLGLVCWLLPLRVLGLLRSTVELVIVAFHATSDFACELDAVHMSAMNRQIVPYVSAHRGSRL